MEDKAFNKKFDGKRLLLELYNHNQYLQAQVCDLTDLIDFVLKSMGESPGEITRLGRELIMKHTARLQAEDADGMYSERWGEILGELKDIDGVDLGGKE